MQRLIRRSRRLQGILVCTLLVHTSAVCSASAPQLVQVPFSVFGDSANAYPLSLGPARYQQIYSAAAFPYGGFIDKIMFRNEEDPSWDLPFTNLPFNLQIGLAYAARSISTASSVFSENIGSNFTVVLDGVIVRSNDLSGPKSEFDFVIDVANTFNYDPHKGDLLMQILKRNYEAVGFFDAASSSQQQVTTRIWNEGSYLATTGQVGLENPGNQYYGLVTQFEFGVPEPSCMALFVVTAVLLSRSRFRLDRQRMTCLR